MAGHIKPSVDSAVKPVDYKGGELSNLVYSEFHHITGRPFLKYKGDKGF